MSKISQVVESVVNMSKLSHEAQCSGFERFVDGLAVIALNGFKVDEIQATQPENEQV